MFPGKWDFFSSKLRTWFFKTFWDSVLFFNFHFELENEKKINYGKWYEIIFGEKKKVVKEVLNQLKNPYHGKLKITFFYINDIVVYLGKKRIGFEK